MFRIALRSVPRLSALRTATRTKQTVMSATNLKITQQVINAFDHKYFWNLDKLDANHANKLDIHLNFRGKGGQNVGICHRVIF